jgi:hypothetical protein
MIAMTMKDTYAHSNDNDNNNNNNNNNDDGYESPGTRLRARARKQLEQLRKQEEHKIIVTRNKKYEAEEDERKYSSRETSSSSSSSNNNNNNNNMMEIEIYSLKEKLQMAENIELEQRRLIKEKSLKCQELIQSNDDLRFMHKEVSKELIKLKRFISTEGITHSFNTRSLNNDYDCDDYDDYDGDDNKRTYLSSLLTEAKSSVLEKQLKIDSLKRKHTSFEKEIKRLLDEQKVTQEKEKKMMERFSLQLENLRSDARLKDDECNKLQTMIESLRMERSALENQLEHMSDKSVTLIQELESEKKQLRDDLVQTRETLKKTFEEAMFSLQREYEEREEKTKSEMREVKKNAFETSKRAYEYGRVLAFSDYERVLETISDDVEKKLKYHETEQERKLKTEQDVFKAKLKSHKTFLLQTRNELKLAKENNAKLSRELTKTYIETDREKTRIERARVAELTKLKECISERRKDVENVQLKFEGLFAQQKQQQRSFSSSVASLGEKNQLDLLQRLKEELAASKQSHAADITSFNEQIRKTTKDSELFEAKLVAHAVEKSQLFAEKVNATAFESEVRTQEMLLLSEKIRSFIEEKDLTVVEAIPAPPNVVMTSAINDFVVAADKEDILRKETENMTNVTKKLYRIFNNDDDLTEKENTNNVVVDFSWTPNESTKKTKSRISTPKRSPLSFVR